jgi:hypothetical protein
MADVVQLNGVLPRDAKLRLRSLLALQGLTYNAWLQEQVRQYLKEQQGERPAEEPRPVVVEPQK